MKLLFLSLMAWACTQPQYPTSVEPAAKALIDPSSSAVEWSCGTDSVWSVFNGRFYFNIDRDEVSVKEITASGRKKRHRTHDATVSYEGGTCTLLSGFISSDSVVRIWKGYVWRDAIHRYYLQDEDGNYRLNRRYITSDGEHTPPFEVVHYRNFLDYWNRDEPRPDGLTRIGKGFSGFYPPINFSVDAHDTLEVIPKDDRPYLIDPIIEVKVEPVVVEEEEEEVKKPRVSRSESSSSSGSGTSSSSSTSSSSTGTGTPTTTVSGGDDEPDNPEEGEEDPEEGEEDPEEEIVVDPVYSAPSSWKVLAISDNCYFNCGRNCTSRGDQPIYFIAESYDEDGNCIGRSECGSEATCSGSSTASDASCAALLNTAPTKPGSGGECSGTLAGVELWFTAPAPCPYGYDCSAIDYSDSHN